MTYKEKAAQAFKNSEERAYSVSVSAYYLLRALYFLELHKLGETPPEENDDE